MISPHVIGIMTAVHGWTGPDGTVHGGQSIEFSPHWNMELIQYPGYEGSIEIGQGELPGFTTPPAG